MHIKHILCKLRNLWIGVFVGTNVINALDAFSSPRGSDALDGITMRGVAYATAVSTLDRAGGKQLERSFGDSEFHSPVVALVSQYKSVFLARSQDASTRLLLLVDGGCDRVIRKRSDRDSDDLQCVPPEVFELKV